MRNLTLIVLLSCLFSSQAGACVCMGNCLEADYDLAAIVEITERKPIDFNQFDAKIIHLKGWQRQPIEKEGHLFKLWTRKTDKITIKTEQTSCARHYKVGQKLYFFAMEVEAGVYSSNQCTCTRVIDK